MPRKKKKAAKRTDDRTNAEVWRESADLFARTVEEDLTPADGDVQAVEVSSSLPEKRDGARQGTLGFKFSVDQVRTCMGIERDVSIPDKQMERYGEVPSAVWEQLEMFYVTGRAHDPKHMALLVAASMRFALDVDLVRFHLSENFDRMNAERGAYLQAVRDATKKTALELAVRPEDQQYVRIVDGLATLVDGVVANVVDGKQTVNVAAVNQLARTVKVLQEIDPVSKRSEMRDRVRAEKEIAGTSEEDRIRAKFLEVRAEEERQEITEDAGDDADMGDLEQMTERTLARIDGEGD